MITKKTIRLIALILFACNPFNGLTQDLSGVWSGKYSDQYGTFKFDMEITYDPALGLYVGQSRTKQTFYTSSNLFAQSDVTFLVAKETADSLFYNEVAADVPPQTGRFQTTEADVKNWKFVGGALVHSGTGEEEKLTGYMQYRKEAKVPITLTRIKPVASEKAAMKTVEALKGLILSPASYKTADRSNNVYENGSGVLTFTVSNTSKYLFKEVATWIFFDQNPTGIIFPGVQWLESGYIGNSTYMNGQSRTNDLPFTATRDIPYDSLSGVLCIQTQNGIVLGKQRFSLPTVKLIKKNVQANANWKADERSGLIASYFGITNYRWNIKPDLDRLSAAGDKKAIMWKALFLHLGQAGYEPDEQMAFSIGSQKGLFDSLVYQLKAGDVESMFLVSVALMMNLPGSHYEEDYEYLLVKAAETDYPPARYMLGMKRLFEKKYNDSKYNFKKALDGGIKTAGSQLGMFDEKGWKTPVNIPAAIESYAQAAVLNDPDALVKLACLYATGKAVSDDNKKALTYFEQAVLTGSSRAKLALADYYIRNKINKDKIFDLTKQAADAGNRDALYQLALLYSFPEMCGLVKDPVRAAMLLKQASELGEANAMNLLGLHYFNGLGVDTDYFLGRFWLSEAAMRGVGEGITDRVTFGQPFMAFIDGVLGYIPDVIVETTYYNDGSSFSREYNDPNPLPYLASGLISLYREVHQQRQPTINDFRLIYKRGPVSTYGGILTSGVNIKLRLTDIVNVYAFGSVNFGYLAGSAGPEGIGNPELSAFSIAARLPHGQIITTINEGKSWWSIGKSATGIVPKSEQLTIAVNDTDYKNNQGYFNIRVDLYDTVGQNASSRK